MIILTTVVSSRGDEELLTELTLPDGYLADEGDESAVSGSSDPADDQALAARRAVEPGIRFTWRPPGTGKTRVLAMAVAQAVADGLRVLVLAHANVAVDVALERIADELGTDHPQIVAGRVVRVGTPRSASMATRAELLPVQIAAQQHPAVAERIAALTAELRQMSDRARSDADHASLAARIQSARTELQQARSELDDMARQVVADATVVATTLSRAVIDDQVWSLPFDVVIVDEASMANCEADPDARARFQISTCASNTCSIG